MLLLPALVGTLVDVGPPWLLVVVRPGADLVSVVVSVFSAVTVAKEMLEVGSGLGEVPPPVVFGVDVLSGERLVEPPPMVAEQKPGLLASQVEPKSAQQPVTPL